MHAHALCGRAMLISQLQLLCQWHVRNIHCACTLAHTFIEHTISPHQGGRQLGTRPHTLACTLIGCQVSMFAGTLKPATQLSRQLVCCLHVVIICRTCVLTSQFTELSTVSRYNIFPCTLSCGHVGTCAHTLAGKSMGLQISMPANTLKSVTQLPR